MHKPHGPCETRICDFGLGLGIRLGLYMFSILLMGVKMTAMVSLSTNHTCQDVDLATSLAIHPKN